MYTVHAHMINDVGSIGTLTAQCTYTNVVATQNSYPRSGILLSITSKQPTPDYSIVDTPYAYGTV